MPTLVIGCTDVHIRHVQWCVANGSKSLSIEKTPVREQVTRATRNTIDDRQFGHYLVTKESNIIYNYNVVFNSYFGFSQSLTNV